MASKIGEVLEIKLQDPLAPWSRWKPVISTSSSDTFVFLPWWKGQPQKILHYKKSYTHASQINARNVADLGISPKLAQWPESQFGAEVLPQTLPQRGVKG